MTSEQLISELNNRFNKEDHFIFFDYITKNIGIFISAISIISAIVLFAARAISFLIVRAKYRFWNLDEGFLVEDNKAFLKLGVYVLFFLLLTLINTLVKRFVYRWELYRSATYLYYKQIAYQHTEIKKCKKKIAKMNKSATPIENINNSANGDCLNELSQIKKDIMKIQKQCSEIMKKVRKMHLRLMARFLLMMLVVFIASSLLLLFSGVDIWDNGAATFLLTSTITTLIIMFTAFLCAFIDIRLTIKGVLKQSFKDKKIDWDSDCITPAINWLMLKINKHDKQNIKGFFSDRSLKILLINVISTSVFMTAFLQFNVKYSLKHLDSFYVFQENQQEYVMLINDGTKYIFSECEIINNELIIDTNKIIVRTDPVNLEKMQFEIVERKQ